MYRIENGRHNAIPLNALHLIERQIIKFDLNRRGNIETISWLNCSTESIRSIDIAYNRSPTARYYCAPAVFWWWCHQNLFRPVLSSRRFASHVVAFLSTWWLFLFQKSCNLNLTKFKYLFILRACTCVVDTLHDHNFHIYSGRLSLRTFKIGISFHCYRSLSHTFYIFRFRNYLWVPIFICNHEFCALYIIIELYDDLILIW